MSQLTSAQQESVMKTFSSNVAIFAVFSRTKLVIIIPTARMDPMKRIACVVIMSLDVQAANAYQRVIVVTMVSNRKFIKITYFKNIFLPNIAQIPIAKMQVMK